MTVIVKPEGRIDTAEGPLYTTFVDGAAVHGQRPLTIEERDALVAIIDAAKRMNIHRKLKNWVLS